MNGGRVTSKGLAETLGYMTGPISICFLSSLQAFTIASLAWQERKDPAGTQTHIQVPVPLFLGYIAMG